MRVIFDGFSHQVPDIDPDETREWVDSFDSVIESRGKNRARFLLMKLLDRARESQVGFPATVSTPYVNTIPADQEPWFPGNEHLERRIRAYIRWNAAVMVTRANMRSEGIGGHLSTFASSASLYEVGFNHFFHGKSDGSHGDQVFFQGHASPGIYARAFLEGRLSEAQLDGFRFEIAGNGLASYPHPRLLPEFWEFPTVSMGLGPLMAVQQAHFNRYLHNRHIEDTSSAKVWCFLGDGEMDEPESLAAVAAGGREALDNLIFVVNCNLQRLDGPVRGNGKVIQEFEALFRGAGWNVIKVIWGSRWDDLLARDVDSVLLNKMNTTVDGEFQKYATESGAYIRERFFGPDPRLRRMVEHLSDEELQALPRGGHDYRKLYAAYKAAVEHTGTPTAILAKTIKGWTLGPEIEARNATHQIKKMSKKQLAALRNRLYLSDEIPDSALDADLPPYYRPPAGSDEYEYLAQRRRALQGPVPSRVVRHRSIPSPDASTFADLLAGSSKQEFSTTMAFARLMRSLIREPSMGARVVPIVPDEARTFGLDALFPEARIYSPSGQHYTPVDADLILSYTESQSGQILEEGITEAGAMATFMAVATSYATWGEPMLPFFIFYSMFGFQRIGDLIWALGDMRGRGFLMGATAGRTTLNGEGLQHEDGHSLLIASAVPNVQAYDPAFAYELAIIIQDGIQRMYGDAPEDIFYYITLYNENYSMPPMPGVESASNGSPQGSSIVAEMNLATRDAILKGLYLFAARQSEAHPDASSAVSGTEPSPPGRSFDLGERDRQESSHQNAQNSDDSHLGAKLLFSGTAWKAVMEARDMLADGWGIESEAWSVTSYKALREEALSVERWNRLHPEEPARTPFVTQALSQAERDSRQPRGAMREPIVAVTDFIKAVPDQIARWIPSTSSFTSLGTDGFGRSDTRPALRRYFEVDAAQITVAVLAAFAASGNLGADAVSAAIKKFGIDPEGMDPRLL